MEWGGLWGCGHHDSIRGCVIIPGQCENITLSQKGGEKNRAISEIDCWKTRTLQSRRRRRRRACRLNKQCSVQEASCRIKMTHRIWTLLELICQQIVNCFWWGGVDPSQLFVCAGKTFLRVSVCFRSSNWDKSWFRVTRRATSQRLWSEGVHRKTHFIPSALHKTD